MVVAVVAVAVAGAGAGAGAAAVAVAVGVVAVVVVVVVATAVVVGRRTAILYPVLSEYFLSPRSTSLDANVRTRWAWKRSTSRCPDYETQAEARLV